MYRVANLIKSRVSLMPQSFLLLNTFRAQKSKADVHQGATTDFIGIFKDRPEPPMRNLEDYPEWLLNLIFAKPNLINLMEIWRSGEKSLYPKSSANEVLRLLHNLQKLKITEMNSYRVIMSKDMDKLPPDEEKYDMFEIMEAERKEIKEEEEEEDDDEDEDDEEEGKKRKGTPNYDDEKETTPPPSAVGKGGPGGKKK